MPFYLSFFSHPFSLSSLSHHCLSFYLSRCGYLFTTNISFSTFLSNHVSLSILFISLISASLHIFFSLSFLLSLWHSLVHPWPVLSFSVSLSSCLSLLPLSFSLKLICVCNFSPVCQSLFLPVSSPLSPLSLSHSPQSLSLSPSLSLSLSLSHPCLSHSLFLPSLSIPPLSLVPSFSPPSFSLSLSCFLIFSIFTTRDLSRTMV